MKKKYKYIITLNFLLISVLCCASSNEINQLLKLIDTNTIYSYENSDNILCASYPLDDYQYLPDLGNFYKHELAPLCNKIDKKALQKIYYANIQKGNIKRIVDLTSISCTFFPDGNDIHFLINNIGLHIRNKQIKYGENRSWGFISNNNTNIALIHSIEYYISQGYRRIPKKDVQWALYQFLNLIHKISYNNKLGFKMASMLNQCIVLCYSRLDPYNYRDQIIRDNFKCQRHINNTNSLMNYNLGSTAIIDDYGSTLWDILGGMTIEGQEKKHPKILFFNRSDYIKYEKKKDFKWPEKMVVSNFFKALEKYYDNEIQIVLTNYNFKKFSTPVIEVKRKTDAERKLGW